MHPLDFFDAAHQPRRERRIGEAFQEGESSIEAPFLPRDGRATPSCFTGRRGLFDGLTGPVGVGIDISERTKAEVALRESGVRFCFEPAAISGCMRPRPHHAGPQSIVPKRAAKAGGRRMH